MEMKDELRAIFSEVDRLGVRAARLIEKGLSVNDIINASNDVLGYKLPYTVAFRLGYFTKKIWGKKEDA